MSKKVILRIESSRLGKVEEVNSFLQTLNDLYNAIIIIDVIRYSSWNVNRNIDRTLSDIEMEFKKHEDIFGSLSRKDLANAIFSNYPLDGHITFQKKIDRILQNSDISSLILPHEKLIMSKVNIQSPGFWEFIGDPEILTIISNFILFYLNNRYNKEGKELNKPKNEQQLIEDLIHTLKLAGYSEIEARVLARILLTPHIERLRNLIEGGWIDDVKKIDSEKEKDNEKNQ